MQRNDPLIDEEEGKALVRRPFDEVFTTENLAAADEIMAEEYVEHATGTNRGKLVGSARPPTGVAPVGRDDS